MHASLLRRSSFAILLALAAAAPAQTPADNMPEAPHWPIGFQLTGDLGPAKRPVPKPGTPDKADILVWFPEGAMHIRSMLVVPNNTDSKGFIEHAALRKVATRHEMGIVYMRNFETDIEGPNRTTPPNEKRLPALLDLVAQKTGIPDFKYAPFITFGKSSRGQFPYRAAWTWPDRTIATITYHGETPTWPVADYAKLNGQTILSVNANGEVEWGGTWFNHVRPSLLNYRSQKGWLSHQTVSKDVGHGDYPDGMGSPGWGKEFPGKVTCIRVWDYLSVFVDKALTLRVPTDKYPTDGPLTLKQVDESTGYLIDPFAVEEMFKVPHLPLVEKDGLYVVGGAEEFPVSGYAALTPPKDFVVPEGVPVVKLELGKSPNNWLVTNSLKFPMKADPINDLGDLAKITPKPGDKITVDGAEMTFNPIEPRHIGPNGGIALNKGLRPPNAKITLFAYTVIDVPEKTIVKVGNGFTAATRIQMVLAGVPVKHKQVLELAPGKYPMLIALRMTVNWDRIEPKLEEVPADQLAEAKIMQVEAEKFAAEQAKAANAPKVLFHKATDIPKDQRARYFWVADKEQLEAWFNLHAIHGQKFEMK